MKPVPLTVYLLLLSLVSFAQEFNWEQVQKDLNKKQNLVELNQQLEAYKQEVIKKHDDVAIAKCYWCQVQIADLRTEDTAYFSNAVFIDSILKINKTPLMRCVMLVLKAKRIAGFRQRFAYRTNKNLFVIPTQSVDYTKLNNHELDSLVQQYLQEAISISVSVNQQDANELLWLSTDPLLFLFKPGLTDIIFAEQLHYLNVIVSERSNSNSGWLLLTADEFIRSQALPKGIDTVYKPILTVYRQWATSQQKQPAAFYYIESLCRKYFFTRPSTADSTYDLYQNYLQQLLQSPYSVVKAHAVYQLCLQWKLQGDKYSNNWGDYLNNGVYRIYGFDTAYRFHYAKAIALLQDNMPLLDSFLYLKNNLLQMQQAIQQSKLGIECSSVQLPGKAITASVTFKNIAAVNCKIVQLNYNQYGFGFWSPSVKNLMNAPAYKNLTIPLPVLKDYQTHAADIDFDALPLGYYAVLFNDASIPVSDSTAGFFTFSVSNIAVINSDKRVFVLDRTTGMPLQQATLMVVRNAPPRTKISNTIIKEVNKEGYAIVSESSIAATLAVNGNDTLAVHINATDTDIPDEVFDKDSDDDLVDYYEDNTRVHFFTDRSIYRPGQTVFFKGILLTRDPATGKSIVFNKQNLQFPLLKKVFNKEIKEFVNGKIEVYVTDAFGRTVDTIKVSLNEYGSFSGSYKLHANAATGEWELETDLDKDGSYNTGEFKVEEYKRPSFELTIDKPKGYLQFGDSFFVKAKVRSFAGADLTNMMINYSMEANFNSVEMNSTSTQHLKWITEELIDTTGYTNNNGELLIKVPVDFLEKYQFNKKNMVEISYTITAEAIDATGESHEESLKVKLTNRPVKIDFSMAAIYERNELTQVAVTAKNEFSGNVNKQLDAVIYKINKKETPQKNIEPVIDYMWKNGQWMYEVYRQSQSVTTDTVFVYKTSLLSNKDKLVLPKALLSTGDYVLEVTCTENNELVGKRMKGFSVFDKKENTYAGYGNDFHYLPLNSTVKGEKIKWYFGTKEENIYSVYSIQYFSKIKNAIQEKYLYNIYMDKAGITQRNFTIPGDAVSDVSITHIYIRNNKLYKKREKIYLVGKMADEPEIIIEQYRSKLIPGSKETFTLTVKTKNENTAAELLTTMYDASLDKLEKHTWTKPFERMQYHTRDNWQRDISSYSSGILPVKDIYKYGLVILSDSTVPLWWINPLSYAYSDLYFHNMYGISRENNLNRMLAGRVSGLIVNSTSALNEVVVSIGYGSSAKAKMASSVVSIRIRGTTSLSNYNEALIVVDGVVYSGDLSKFNTDLITDAIVLKGADATALYGSRAASGVVIISTKGLVELPKPEEPPVKIRKDFSETAFFFPQAHADNDGYYNVSFVIPESVTEWNWKMLAHTKDAQFMYTERKITTQLPLMVQPNMPRFLYQGDEINLQTRITNLDTADLAGISTCRIEDAVTGEDITSQVSSINKQQFSVEKKSNGTVAYRLVIPQEFLHPLKIKIAARAGSFGDGEEYTIPILSKKILVSQTLPFTYSNAADSNITTPLFPGDASPYGIGLYILPKPQAAMVNALPYLAFYPYGCAEQIFNKMLAHAMAIKIIQKDTIAQQTIKQQQLSSIQNIVNALPDELAEQTMPWLQLQHQTNMHQQQLIRLFDTMQSKAAIEKYIALLKDLQQPDGGISWFKGSKSDPYISYYLLSGFGKLRKDNIPFLFKNSITDEFKLLPSLIMYCDSRVSAANKYWQEDIEWLYARSSWLQQFPFSDKLKSIADSVLNVSWKNIHSYGLGKQAMLIITSMRYKGKDMFNEKAHQQLESIRQLAIADNVNGIRWKDISNTDDFDSNDEEIIALLATAFDESGYSKLIVDGILQWLLTAKEQHNWPTTKATAAVVGLLYKNQSTVTGMPLQLNATVGDSAVSVTDNLLKGQVFDFKQLKVFPQTMSLKKAGGAATKGGFTYYYFTANPPKNEQYSAVKISKQLFKLTQAGIWEKIDDKGILKIADKIKTIITIEAPKQLKYVFIDEKRAASTEPTDAESGYKYGKSLSYYCSVRDAGYQFFAEQIPSGITTIEYETITAKEGMFNSGTISLQCMYQPQVRAYGSGIMINVSR